MDKFINIIRKPVIWIISLMVGIFIGLVTWLVKSLRNRS